MAKLTPYLAIGLFVFGQLVPSWAATPDVCTDQWKTEPTVLSQIIGPLSRGRAQVPSVLSGGSAFAEAGTASPGLRTLAEREGSWREIQTRLGSLNANQLQDFLSKAKPLIARVGPRSYSETEFLHAIQFIGHDAGWALDWNGRLVATTDGGATWIAMKLPVERSLLDQAIKGVDPNVAAMRGLHFADRSFGLAVGQLGSLLTRDGGKTWERPRMPTWHPALSVHCSPSRTCWAGGERMHTILRRDENSSAWVTQQTPAAGPVSAIQFIGELKGWAVSRNGEVIATTDGGAHWKLIYSDRTKDFFALHFIDEMRGWAAGANGPIMNTDDGGRTWGVQNIPPLPAGIPPQTLRFHAIRFLDAQSGWVAGLNGLILGTEDGGRCWKVQRFEGFDQHSLTIYALAISQGPDGLHVWAAGNTGNIFVSRDRGVFWFPVHGLVNDIEPIFRKLLFDEP